MLRAFASKFISTLLTAILFAPLAHSAEGDNTESQLKGLILVKSEEALLKEGDPGLAVTGLHVKEIEVLQGEDFAKLIEPFFGRVVNADLLKEIQSTIQNYHRKRGFPLVDPVFPPQTVAGGVLQLIVIQSKLGKLIFEGTNKWTKVEFVQKNLRVTESEPINERKLTEDLNWLNRNKFRSVSALYKPGEGKYESDLVIRTAERFPLGGSITYDNTGNRLTGEGRMSVGADWGKAFGLHDHLLSYRYLTDTEFEFLKAHVMNYSVFLPWRHTLTLSGSHADVKGDIPGLPVVQEGQSYQANLRYTINLPSLRRYRHEFQLGADYRHLDNSLEYNFVNVLADTTEIAQGLLGYTGLLPDKWGNTVFGAEYDYSPGNLSSLNTDDRFGLSYPFAEADYHYAKFHLERVTRLPAQFSWRINGTYQIADGNLVPSEQFGLGGFYTVRGYEERASSGSEGFLISNELRTPSFSPGQWLDKTAKDELQLLGFFDYGQTSNPKLLPGEDAHVELMSAGVGLRYQISRFLTVRFDYGWQLETSEPVFRDGKSRGHVMAALSF